VQLRPAPTIAATISGGLLTAGWRTLLDSAHNSTAVITIMSALMVAAITAAAVKIVQIRNKDVSTINARNRGRALRHWMRQATGPEERERAFKAEVAAETIKLESIEAGEKTAEVLLTSPDLPRQVDAKQGSRAGTGGGIGPKPRMQRRHDPRGPRTPGQPNRLILLASGLTQTSLVPAIPSARHPLTCPVKPGKIRATGKLWRPMDTLRIT
jgi:hypothetical protein